MSGHIALAALRALPPSWICSRPSGQAYTRDRASKTVIALICTVGVAFMLGFIASRGVFGSHGWALALIGGAAVCAGIGVALVPLRQRGT
jgi:hypothetical protein